MMRSRLIRLAMAVLVIAPAGTASAGPFANVVGTWWGQAEYFAKVKAVPDEAAQAVVDLTVTVVAGGKISGASPANGCRLSGVLMPGATAQNYRSQVSVSGCWVASLNGRYMGPVSVKPQAGTLALSLTMSQPGGLGRDSRWGTVTATMVRR